MTLKVLVVGALTLPAAGPAVRERSAPRVEALGGTVMADGPGTVHLRLPLGPVDEERELGER
jgi:hypothetical protein